MKNHKLVLIGALVIGVLMSGCSSAPGREQLAKDDVRAAEIRAKAEDEKRALVQKRMEAEISQVPEWVLKQPRPDDTGVYAVGQSESDKMRVAIRKAVLEAEFGLAKIFNQELSGSERSYSQENNSRVNHEQYTALIDKLVSQVPVVGFEVVNQEVKAVNGQFNAYVLVKLPYAQFNHVLQDQRAKTEDRTIVKAFDDLEHRLSQRRQQILEEQRQQKIQDGAKQTGLSANDAKLADSKNSAAPITSTEATVGARE
jgi:hypothetical protein